MTFRIPSTSRQLSQLNNSDVTGNLYATRNIDLDEEGYIKLASSMVSVYSVDNDADFRNVNSIFHGSNLYFVGTDLFRSDQLSLKPTFTNVTATDTTPPSPGAEEDGVYFNNTEVVSDGDTLKYNASGTWTTISGTPTSASAAVPSPVAVFPAQNSMLFARANKVARINTSWAVAVTLTLPPEYIIVSMDVNGNYAYIGTRHIENGEAALFLWTGINTTNDGSYGAGTYEVSSVRKYGSSVAIMNSLGQLMQFNGSGFTELAALPVYFTRSNWADASNNNNNIGSRGMVVDGDLIYLIFTTKIEDIETMALPNMIGGIWCYDPRVGLYQKHSITNNIVLSDESVDTADINTTTDVITVSGIVVPPTGSPVFAGQSNTMGGVMKDRWYYVIKVTDTTCKLAETYEDALLGTSVNITSATDGNDFYFIKQYDYGIGLTEDSQSAILVLNNVESRSGETGRILFTSEVPTTTAIGTNKWRAMITCPKIRNAGYFVTPKMFADGTSDNFNSMTLRFRPLSYGDKIVVKYRITEKKTFPAMPRSQINGDNTVTWTSSTVFTTPTTPSEMYYDFSEVEIGDEVEVINGAGAGFIAHVASISVSGFQYTVTLDEANPFILANDQSMVKIDNWKVLDTIDSTFEDVQKTVSVDDASGWCQFKVYMEGVDVAIYDTVTDNKFYSRAR